MSTSRKWVVAAVVAVVLLAGAGVGLYLAFFRDDAPPPVSLDAAVEEAQDATTDDAPDTSADSQAAFDGTWSVVPGDGTDAGSFAGYRVQEELADIGAKTAAGRTGAITGAMVIEGTAVERVDIEVDMTQLKSDSSSRDGQMRQQALETTAFPTATFSLTSPIELDAVPAEGETVTVTATGDLTLHGVTRSVGIPLEARLVGGQIVVVGSLPVLFSDYEIDKPQSFRVLSIADNGVMELQLFLERDDA